MEKVQSIRWFQKVFLIHTSHLIGKKILFLDGHASHVTMELIDKAIKNDVELLCLPAHTSHVLQPLDVGVFSVVKATWKKNLRQFFSMLSMLWPDFTRLAYFLWTQLKLTRKWLN